MKQPINLRAQTQTQAQGPATSAREVLTKQALLEMLESLPLDAEVRVDIKLSEIAKAKKCMAENATRLAFELSEEMIYTESGAVLEGWVDSKRLPSANERIMGYVLIEREVGFVKWFNDTKGLGFIIREDGQDVFVHYEAIRGEGFRCLKAGSEVEYTLYQTTKGLQAQDVITLSEPEDDVEADGEAVQRTDEF